MKTKVAVIGAGLGGLCMGFHLQKAGIEDFVILERADRVGGTWRENTYPGCACDTPVVLYQFSFAPTLLWSHIFPRAAEVQKYTEQLADDFQLRPHLRLNEAAAQATWDEAAAHWRITTTKGEIIEAEVLVSALGQLNRPLLPDIAGRDSFAGPAFHSAQWNHSLDLAGKRVGVIGSAASAVQLIPEVAKVASHLTVFQRSPNWLLPRLDRPISDEEKALLLTEIHMAMLDREYVYKTVEHLLWKAFEWTPEGRAAYQKRALIHLEDQIADPKLREKLTPNYPIGCKRILFSDDFYPTLERPNVTLETAPISRITSTRVETAAGAKHECDVLVYATGFETTGWHWSVNIEGRNHQSLAAAWHDAPEAYLGIAVSGFPNFFMLYGPNTNLGHNTITFMLERQAEYIVQALTGMEEKQIAAMDPTPEAQALFNENLQQALAKTTWADPACHSWYKRPDGRITQNWSSHTRAYESATKTVNFTDYRLR